jgi:NADH-quinone oxidoreductase subunit N
LSTPLVWIVFPGLLAVVLYFLRGWRRATIIIGILATLALAWMAWKLPIGEPVNLGPFSGFYPLRLGDTLVILGRRFVIGDSLRPVLILIYLSLAFWFGGAGVAQADQLFVPLGLAMAALLTAALAVEPFLFAALLIELAALACVPILASPGKPSGRGVLRFLVFQTAGMACILFSGWMLGQVGAAPTDPALIARGAILLGLGFAFFMGVFPFHTWIPMLTEEARPYAAAFVFFVLPGAIAFFGLGLLDRYAWMRAIPATYTAIRFVGALMVVTGGVWAAFQRHLGRIMGYTVTVEIGLSLLALSLGASAESKAIFYALFLPRGLCLVVWALGLEVILAQAGDLRYRAVHGWGRRLPLAMAGVVLANFALAGLPLLAGFPVRIALTSALAEQDLSVALLTLVGAIGLLVGAIRTLIVLVTGPKEEKWLSTENRGQRSLLGVAVILLFVVGMFPHWFLPTLTSLARLLGQPGP